MQFLRSIQLDDSDNQVFQQTAASGEWAVPGSFALLNINLDSENLKLLESFKHGFIGTNSFGHTSLVTIADISPAELADVIEHLTAFIHDTCGAPSNAAARRAAEEEVGFTLEIATHPPGTLIAVERELTEDGIEERYKTLSPPEGVDHSRMRLWALDD